MTALVFRLWQKPNENHNIANIGKIVAILQFKKIWRIIDSEYSSLQS